jgi:chemotaxis methyl-accepting protein methylase
MDELPEDLAARHLVPVPGKGEVRFAIGADVRARVRLEVLDLLSGTSPGEGAFDLICCRNVLIYYQSEAHKEIIGLFRRSLRPGGFLFLGEAEWPPEPHASALECVARGARVFRSAPGLHA